MMKRRKNEQPGNRYDRLRHTMVDQQLESRDISNPRVLDAMRRIPRHLFVPPKRIEEAYLDSPVLIGFGQTISQPYVVASMTQELHLTDNSRVLEIGTGCGYQTAILSELAKEVYTVEVVPELTERARRVLKKLRCRNVRFEVRDGSLGWPEHAPYDAIIVTAAAPRLPQPLVDQMADNGRMVIPLASDSYGRQFLTLVTRDSGKVRQKTLYEVRFVPMVGEVEGR